MSAFWEHSETSKPPLGAQPFSVWASLVSLRFLLWQVCRIFVILRPEIFTEQWPPVTISYHRPVTVENHQASRIHPFHLHPAAEQT